MTNRYDDTAAPASDPNAVTPGNMADAVRGTAFANRYAAADTSPPPKTLTQELTDVPSWARAAGLTGRAVSEGVAGLPLMAMDAGVATRNLLGDLGSRIQIAGKPLMEPSPDYPLPSQTFEQQLTQAGLPEPQTGIERGTGMVEAALTGSRLPGTAPGITEPAPPNFMTPAATKAQLTAQMLQKAQGEGFVVPPSTTNPSFFNRTLETVAGKENVQNWARRINDAVRQRSAASSLGFSSETPLTVQSMDAIKAASGEAYESARAVPMFRTSNDYLTRLAEIEQQNMGANASFPGAASPDVAKIIDTYLQPGMTGDSAVSAIKLLRTKASDAFSAGNSETGRVYRQIQGALEDELERGATAHGQPNLVQKLRAARQQYAKASTIQDAMEPDGTVTGPGLARAWNNNVPMSGPLESAAEFARQFPKANLSSAASGSPVSHLSTFGPLIAGGGLGEMGEVLSKLMPHGHGAELSLLPAAGVVTGLSYPLIRAAARRRLLSPAGQAGALPPVAVGPGGRQISPAALAAGLQAYSSGGGQP